MASSKINIMHNKQVAFLILLLLTIFLSVSSQTLSIDSSNPYPRVGHEFEVNIDLSFFEKIIIEDLDSTLEVINSELSKTKLKLIASDTGQLKIGPYRFEFNGKEIMTDSLIINISKKLGEEEGLWIKKYSSNKTDYIILEEIASAKWINESGRKTSSHRLDMPKSNKAILVDDNKKNISFTMITGRYLPLSENKDKDFTKEIIYYSREIYIVDNPENKPLTIELKLIKNKPRSVTISDELLHNKVE